MIIYIHIGSAYSPTSKEISFNSGIYLLLLNHHHHHHHRQQHHHRQRAARSMNAYSTTNGGRTASIGHKIIITNHRKYETYPCIGRIIRKIIPIGIAIMISYAFVLEFVFLEKHYSDQQDLLLLSKTKKNTATSTSEKNENRNNNTTKPNIAPSKDDVDFENQKPIIPFNNEPLIQPTTRTTTGKDSAAAATAKTTLDYAQNEQQPDRTVVEEVAVVRNEDGPDAESIPEKVKEAVNTVDQRQNILSETAKQQEQPKQQELLQKEEEEEQQQQQRKEQQQQKDNNDLKLIKSSDEKRGGPSVILNNSNNENDNINANNNNKDEVRKQQLDTRTTNQKKVEITSSLITDRENHQQQLQQQQEREIKTDSNNENQVMDTINYSSNNDKVQEQQNNNKRDTTTDAAPSQKQQQQQEEDPGRVAAKTVLLQKDQPDAVQQHSTDSQGNTSTIIIRKEEGGKSPLKKSSSSLFDYLSSVGFVHKIVLLKWDPDGKLERSSPVDFPEWFPGKNVQIFNNAGPSKYGKVALLLNTNILHGIKWDVQPPTPLLTYTLPKNSYNKDNYFRLLPSPYDRDGYARWCTGQAELVQTPYDQRKNIIVWRGKPHNLPNRIKLLELSKEQDPNNLWLNAVNIAEEATQSLERSKLAEYKYQLDIGGESGTAWGGLRWKMCSGNLVFKVDTWSQDWWHDTIEPWKHYIPVKDDLTDLREQYNWAESHPTESFEIMQRGREVCKNSATEAAIERYQHSAIQSLPESSEDIIKEANTILDGKGMFWKDVNATTALDRSKTPIEEQKQQNDESPPMIETSPAAIPIEGTPSTSIYRYLQSASYPHMIAILKWNASGILDRISPLDIPNWFPEEGRKHFMHTTPSRHGTVAFLLNTDVMAAVPWDTTPPIPFLTYTVPKKCENNTKFTLVPSPYDRESFNRVCVYHAEKITLTIPFQERKNVIVWRGITHGISDPNRHKLFEMSKEDVNNEWLDAVNVADDKSKYLERDEMSKWRYQLDIGGESGTTWGGLRWKMCSGNLVFKVDTWAKDWWHDTIKPWKHYIPVKEDLRDLREMYDWAENHPTEVDEIIKSAVTTCQASLAEEAISEYHQKAMKSLPPASEEQVKEADDILDGLGSFYQTILDRS